MSHADERVHARAKAEDGDFAKALQIAEAISDGWYRAQSLAAVARYAPDGEVVRVANRALKATLSAGDGYKRVGSAAWPIAALVTRNKTGAVQKVIAAVLTDAQSITHPVSKMDALELVWQAVYPSPDTDLKRTVAEALLSACLVADSWKAGRTMTFMAQVTAAENKTEAQRIVSSMRESRYKRQAQKYLDAGKTLTVRGF